MPMWPRIGVDASVTMVPFGASGTNWRSFTEAELIHPAAMRLPATHGAPVTGSVNGLPVSELLGFVSVVRSAVKSPARWAALGTKDCTVWACWLLINP